MSLTAKFVEIPQSEHDTMLDMLSDAENKCDNMESLLKDIRAWLRDRVGGWQYIESSEFFADKSDIIKRIDDCLPNAKTTGPGDDHAKH